MPTQWINSLIQVQKKKVFFRKMKQPKSKKIFERVLNNNALNLQVEALPTDELPVVITVPEFMRRAQEMAKNKRNVRLG